MTIFEDYFNNVLQVNYTDFINQKNLNENNIVINTLNITQQLSDPFNPSRYVFVKSNILGEPENALTFKESYELIDYLLNNSKLPNNFTKEDFSSQNIWRYGLENLSEHVNSLPLNISKINRNFLFNLLHDFKNTFKNNYFQDRYEKYFEKNKLSNFTDLKLTVFSGNYVKAKIKFGVVKYTCILVSDDNFLVTVNWINNSDQLVSKNYSDVKDLLSDIEIFEVLQRYEYWQ
jgi:hypothetical protein